MEEKNAKLEFAREDCKTEEDLSERAEYFCLVRKQHLKRLRERISDGDLRAGTSRRVCADGWKEIVATQTKTVRQVAAVLAVNEYGDATSRRVSAYGGKPILQHKLRRCHKLLHCSR